MSNPPQDEITAYFRAEVPGLLAAIETGLLGLRQDHSVPAYYRLLRAAHSLKGGAASVSMYSIQTLAQCLEDVFQTLLAQSDTDVELIEDLLLQGFDCLRLPLSQWLKTGLCDPDFGLRRAKVIYAQLTDLLGPVPVTMQPVSADDLGVDVTQTIFEHDIAPKIAEIEVLLSASSPSSLAGELRAQFDLLSGLGEMLHLRGLSQISRVVIQALIDHPEQAVVIGELALRDLQAVLGGRHQGGEPSFELLTWAQTAQGTGELLAEMDDKPQIQSPIPSEAPLFWDEIGDDTIHQVTENLTDLYPAESLESTLFWDEIVDLTTPQINALEPEPSTDLFWAEMGEIPAQEPSPIPDIPTDLFGVETPESDLTEPLEPPSFWDEIDYTTTPQLNHPEPEPSTDSFWEEINENTPSPSGWEDIGFEPNQELNTPEPDNATDSFWGEIDEIIQPEPPLESESLTNLSWEEVNANNQLEPTASFWEEINFETTPQSSDSESNNLTDSFWQEMGEIAEPSPEIWAENHQEVELNPVAPLWTGPALPPDAAINPEALEFFAQEAQDLLQELESGLLTLRQNHDIPHIHALMRAAHSIKGGAATVGLPVIQVIAHRLENALQILYQWPGELDVPLEEALLHACDTLRQPLQSQLAGENFNLDTVLHNAEQAFLQLEQILGPTEPTGGDAYMPSSQDLGVDMTATIFSGDIQQGLERLGECLAQPVGDWVAEVTGQLEVFANLGELLNLSGWRAVCEAGSTALAQHPDQAIAITQVLLRDLRQGYAQVMGGEREYGGAVSPELQAFLAENVPLFAVPESRPESTTPEPPTQVLTQTNISTLFDQLPPATDGIAPPPVAPVTPKVAETQPQAGRGAIVRVEVSRLERLNNLIGELVIQENGSFLYQQQLQKLVQTFGQRLNKFETIGQMLEDTADQLTLTTNSINPANSEFDPLQMDSYNQLYTWVQTVIEEIAQVGEVLRDMGLITQQSQENLRKKQQTLKQIRGDLLWIRMVPLQEVLQRFPRMVRDLCVQHHKQVEVRLIGANTLVDKAVLEKLTDPLVHLVRNAFDHGIESPQIRSQQGKNPAGEIQIQAYYRGNQTYITVGDDGQGVNLERVRQKAMEKQIFTPEQGVHASQTELLNCLFTPGFSTAATVSDLSGRGVGLDVVRLQIQELKGSIHIQTEPGRGTTFTIRLPLTLTITKLLVFSLERRWFALAVDSLAAIVTVNEAALVTMQGRQLYRWQGRLVPMIPPSVLEYRYPVRWAAGEGATLPAGQGRPLLLLSVNNEIYGLEIDQILLEQDLVIKPFSGLLAPPDYLYGCTILGDGRLVPVLDGIGLVNHWLRTPEVGAVVAKAPIQNVQQTEILVVDDSLTIRGTLGKMLTKHGYRVHTAADGREALELLAQNPQIQAIFSDVEMPRMNGFEFLSACRQDQRYQSLPIIMLTSRAGEKHQKMAKNLGCNAYLTKPYLEPDLLATLQKFV
ncbi:response regulator [Gloeomargarita lithophora]|uniref:hybrid sensor histidine kinase/response regulator n=1 Tax=Gloeomargarita lithophora TaxID=1188228 RepID=UPI003F70C8E6